MLDLDYVITIHDEILAKYGGLPGFASGGRGGVEAAIQRVGNHVFYAGLNDVFGIAAAYAVAIARGHVFTT
jgi:death-on-curing protein